MNHKSLNKCTIILSFIENYTESFLLEKTKDSDYIICADGGQDIAAKHGIDPSCVIGDLDSTILDQNLDCIYITYPSEKDITDAEACVKYALDNGYNQIEIIGGIGGRLDHTLGALSLLSEFYDKNTNIRLLDSQNSVFLIYNDTVTINKEDGYDYFGVVPLDNTAKGVSITGAKYNLDNITMLRNTTLGISNEIREDSATITVSEGFLYIVQSSDCK